MRRSSLPAVAAALFFLSLGCGESGPRLVPVAGTVTLNGEPLEGAGVTFAPDPGNSASTPGGASSGPGGAFTARSGDSDGLAPGKYKVLVTKSTLKDGAKIPDEFKNDPIMAAMSGLAVDSLPPEYSTANTSPLDLLVPDQGGDDFTFDVKQAKKKK